VRLDAYLVTNGLCRSRATAAEAIRAGQVTVNGKTATKPSLAVTDESVAVNEKKERYVSRGGYKLEGALTAFGIDVTGLTCVDIGASTGGFTDCLLQHGALSVLAIDVGSNQLVESLRNDARVTSLEQTNIRTFVPQTPHLADFVCVDVSFISLSPVLPAVSLLLRENGRAVCLIKPQFEAGKEHLGKNGIVRDEKVHARVLRDVKAAAEENGLQTEQIIPSPLRGGDGNIEFLAYMKKKGASA